EHALDEVGQAGRDGTGHGVSPGGWVRCDRGYGHASAAPQGELVDVEVAGAEARLAVGEVELPHPAEGAVEPEGGDVLPVVEEPAPPGREGPGVVRPQAPAFGDVQRRVVGEVAFDRG